jgi:diguanylate cyclase (GGDEF)-like protein/PAS domain S-box-containing protein
MNVSLFASTAFSLFAFGAAVVLLLRYRSWRFGFFAAATAVVAALLLGRHSATFLSDQWVWTLSSGRSDVGGIGLSAMAMFAVVFLERLINRQIKAEQALELPRYSVDRAAILAFWIGQDGRIVDANECACECLGYAKADLLTRTVNDIDRSLGRVAWTAHWEKLKGSRSLTYETTFRTLAGPLFTVDVTATHFEFGNEEYCVAFAQDITERKRQEQALEYQASHDPLTDLPNRTKFTGALQHALGGASRGDRMLAVLLLDLDRFKDVNDTLGHSVGDRLLQELATRLADQMPEQVTFARFGGDEFALLLPEMNSQAEAENFANMVLEEVQRPFAVDDVILEVGGSIGVAIFPEHGRTPEELLQHADIAMYAAKRDHLGFDLYRPESDPHSVRNLTLTGDLRRAIESDGLSLAFQPKVDLRAGKVSGVEVLARWLRPSQGWVSPDEFITHAEQCGLILPLTKWVLNAALKQGAEWRRAGHDIDIAVNLSARLLHHGTIIPTIMSILRRWDYPSHRLTLEVTENALLADPRHAMEVVEELAGLGVKVSIDDFGKGYSSLAYLKTLAARELKIDKSFVLGMAENASDRTIVKSVIALAHDLGLRVVAEGIETMDVLEMLVGVRCDLGQGFLFGQPRAAEDFLEWLEETNARRAASAKKPQPRQPRIAASPWSLPERAAAQRA